MSFIVSAISFYYSYAIYASVNATELLGIRVGGTNRVTDWPITRLELLLNDRGEMFAVDDRHLLIVQRLGDGGAGESVGRLSKVSSFFIESPTLRISFFFFLFGRKRLALNHVVHRIAIFRGNFVEFLWDVASESSFERREEKQGMSPGQIYRGNEGLML